MAADTSSSAAASTPVVGVAAAAFAAVSAEPMLDKFVAAEPITSGAAITYAMSGHPTTSPPRDKHYSRFHPRIRRFGKLLRRAEPAAGTRPAVTATEV